jgi:hypothetical protein
MLNQMRINDAGELEPDVPRSWDGEPLWSVSTVAEGSYDPLFDPSAFEQLRGQMSLEDGNDGR